MSGDAMLLHETPARIRTGAVLPLEPIPGNRT